jgi:rare lipoprotein A
MMWVLFFFTPGISFTVEAQRSKPKEAKAANKKVFYGLASFYSNKFNGRKTANGEIFSQSKMTCACNVVKLGTWLRVTNLRNGRSVIVKSNDRLHTKMKRVVDLTSAAAKKLGYTKAGLTRVKVEVLGRKRPAE